MLTDNIDDDKRMQRNLVYKVRRNFTGNFVFHIYYLQANF